MRNDLNGGRLEVSARRKGSGGCGFVFSPARILQRLLGAVALAGFVAGAVRAESLCSNDGAVASAVHEYFSRLEHYGFGGVIRVSRPECLIVEEAFGFADLDTGRRNQVGTAFDIGSISKWLTATAIITLVQEGRIDLDASVQLYLPEVPDDKSGVTIRQLLTHRSGLDDDYWELHRDIENEEAYVAMMLGRPPVAAPDSGFFYSNFGYHLLKRVIERVSGMGLESYLRSAVTLPAGAPDIGFALAGWEAADIAFYQDRTTRRWTELGLDVANALNRPRYFQPEGSGYMYATAPALDRLAREVASGRLVRGGWDAYAPSGDAFYGFGLEFAEGEAGRHVGHGGYDDTVGTLARVRFYRDSDINYILLSNTHFNGMATADTFTPVMEALLNGREAEGPPLPAADSDMDLETLAGSYVGPWGGDVLIEVRQGRLMAVAASADSASALILPAMWSDEAATPGDSRVQDAMSAIDAHDRVRLAPLLSPQFRTDQYYEFVEAGWSEIVGALGPLREIRDLHTRQYDFADSRETWRIFMTVHDNGRMLFRAIEDENGLLFLNTLPLPAEFETVLAPIGPRTFASWNPHLAFAAQFEFMDGGLLHIRMSGIESMVLRRKQ